MTIPNKYVPDIDTRIYNGEEVQLTGRTAVRSLRRNRTETVYEIKSLDPEAPIWTKWVKESELYIIQNENIDDNQQ